MIKRPRLLAFAVVAAAALLPAVAQAHWFDPCRCQRAPLHPHYYSHYHHHHHYRHFAVELTQNVFAVPYHLRRYPYVSGIDRYIERGVFYNSPHDRVIIEENLGERGEPQTIDADAQVTIMGRDRMNIQLFRKGHGKSLIPGD